MIYSKSCSREKRRLIKTNLLQTVLMYRRLEKVNFYFNYPNPDDHLKIRKVQRNLQLIESLPVGLLSKILKS